MNSIDSHSVSHFHSGTSVLSNVSFAFRSPLPYPYGIPP